MRPLSERIKNFGNTQFVDWLCLACVDVREVRTPDAAQEEIDKIRDALMERLSALEQRAEAAEVEKAGAEERCRMMFDAKNHWADRARAAEAKMVPDSWQLVPIEPSWEMLSADGCKEHHNGQPCLHHDNRKRIWSAMLTAAPTPPE
ncbi:hypothetical protein [Pantoea sp. 9140]|uniref:hypothetical protein n=1 Tax=Pantoea sp. 9140 TaxID=1500896 RepID=UPI0005353077|nr:hypothetical protein [Pantoea sp. 9140]